MANPTSKLDLVVNGVTTSYEIHDANAIPRSGGAVISGNSLGRDVDNGNINICGGTNWENGAFLALRGKNNGNEPGNAILGATDGTNFSRLILKPDGTATWNNKNLATQEDTIPRSGGAVLTGIAIGRVDNSSYLNLCGGLNWSNGATISLTGKMNGGQIILHSNGETLAKDMKIYPDGTWTWQGQDVQLISDQRLKQQIAEIDDKLLDAWEDVDLVQFKYNESVNTKGKSARLHTGYVVQQIQKACESHSVDISQYGLFCHEEYTEETEEVEVEQADGTKTKETKVIREASEHYSLRYTEVYAVECMYLRRCIARLTARIEQLEKEQEASK